MAAEDEVRPDPGRELDALPVVLRTAGPHATAIRRWVESVAGWQAVGADTADVVPPVLALVDAAGSVAPGAGLPTILLVAADDPPADAARAAAGATAVVAWPEERDDLLDVAGSVAASVGPAPRRARDLTVGGASGGVGTTTLALALGGVAAWRRSPTLVLTHGAVPAPRGRPVAVDDLDGAGTWEVAAAAPGVPDLRVLVTTGPARGVPVDAGPAGLVVRDAGVDADVEVLVVRRDRAGIEAAARSTAAVVAVVDDGPAPERALAAALGGRRAVRLPWSPRVARAGLAGAVPARLPGTWLRTAAAILATEVYP